LEKMHSIKVRAKILCETILELHGDVKIEELPDRVFQELEKRLGPNASVLTDYEVEIISGKRREMRTAP
jgi:hypothetical protein